MQSVPLWDFHELVGVESFSYSSMVPDHRSLRCTVPEQPRAVTASGVGMLQARATPNAHLAGVSRLCSYSRYPV